MRKAAPAGDTLEHAGSWSGKLRARWDATLYLAGAWCMWTAVFGGDPMGFVGAAAFCAGGALVSWHLSRKDRDADGTGSTES